MSLKTFLVSRIADRITSAETLAAKRDSAERRRLKAGEPHVVHYFHQADDPYSHLAAQVLPLLLERYDIVLKPHLVGPPPDWAAPDRARLESYSRTDAERLGARAGLSFRDPGVQPRTEAVEAAQRALAQAIAEGRFPDEAADIGAALWFDSDINAPAKPAGEALAEGDALRARLGHYLGATFHYGGEWYWGPDRLHYLEERLAELGARKDDAPVSPIYAQPELPSPGAAPSVSVLRPDLHFFLSFRSPYTYIATQRVKALADAMGAELKLRFVLPMVMRGMQVPAAKRSYITLDAAREARRNAVPFGRIADPLGRPVERGYSLLPWAIDQGRGYDYCLAFMRSVWSKGVDAGSDAGMRSIVEDAGLDWSEARTRIDNPDWRAEADANRKEMFAGGVWGVPSFRVGEVCAWGQDRLWVIADALKTHARVETRPSEET
ncbi:MAG: DsbA family protein [Hyphomonadaceae bacterium]